MYKLENIYIFSFLPKFRAFHRKVVVTSLLSQSPSPPSPELLTLLKTFIASLALLHINVYQC
jgi:hypothetical protein